MGNLGLDFSSSIARLSRARQLSDLLKADIDQEMKRERPYKLRVGQSADADGWIPLFMVPRDLSEHRFGIQFGEVLYNLRCSLGYMVVELVGKSSGASLTSRHKFPICESREEYVAQVEKPAHKGKGPLGGVHHGTREIEALQPYNWPEPANTALFIVNRFCNADKHREIATVVCFIGAGSLRLENCHITESREPTPRPLWEPGREHHVADIKLAPPYMQGPPPGTKWAVRYEAPLWFRTTRICDEEKDQAFALSELGRCCNRVEQIIETFVSL